MPSRISTTIVALLTSLVSDPLTLGKKVRIEGTVVFARGSGAQRGEAKAWAAKEDAKRHMCACGCGGRIRVTARQFKRGVPKWLRAHHFGLNVRVYKLRGSHARRRRGGPSK